MYVLFSTCGWDASNYEAKNKPKFFKSEMVHHPRQTLGNEYTVSRQYCLGGEKIR